MKGNRHAALRDLRQVDGEGRSDAARRTGGPEVRPLRGRDAWEAAIAAAGKAASRGKASAAGGAAARAGVRRHLSQHEEALALQLRAAGVEFEREVVFWPGRRWRFDFAFRAALLAVEVQGGIWTAGRHTTGAGMTAECEKVAHASMAGWRVMPVTGDQVASGQALQWIQAAVTRQPC